jgi:hypothetical protein
VFLVHGHDSPSNLLGLSCENDVNIQAVLGAAQPPLRTRLGPQLGGQPHRTRGERDVAHVDELVKKRQSFARPFSCVVLVLPKMQ